MINDIEEILTEIENDWDKRQGWFWRVRNKLIYNFTRKLYERGAPKNIPDPSIDKEGEPFSFYAKPSMQLGIPGVNVATRVDSDGQLHTGNGKFLLFSGNPIKPIQKRIWTLTKGHLPEINYTLVIEGIKLSYKAFQFDLFEGHDEACPLNFIQVEMENLKDTSNFFSLLLGTLFSPYQVIPMMIKHPRFNKYWTYEFKQNQAIRDGKLLYTTSILPDAYFSKMDANERTGSFNLIPYSGKFRGIKHKLKKNSITLIQQYRFNFQPGEKRILVIKIPQFPINVDDRGIINRIEQADVGLYRQEFIEFWETILKSCTNIIVPEDKVTNTHKASLIYNFMCQNVNADGTIEQHVNRFQYNHFWIRDSSFYANMYAKFNRADIAEKLLLHFLDFQDEKGNFRSQPGQLDGWGQTLWTFGEYIKLTGDIEFAERIFNPMMRAIDYLKNLIEKDNWGILPPRFAADNEMISGRYTGYNLWAWHGLNNAAFIASFLKKHEEKAMIESFKEDLLRCFLPILDVVCKHHEDRVPPGLDTDIGEDWSNLLLLYPTKLLETDDPKIKATLSHYREHKMPEGIAMWMVFLHHYITERIAQQHLILGDQELVLRDFYSMLSHTGSCHEGFEHNIKPFGNRHYLIPIRVSYLKMDYFNYPPHGWFAVCYNLLLRNMLLREEDDDLHLISALSPEWMGGNMEITNANTYYGTCNLIIKSTKSQLELKFSSSFERGKPNQIVIHVPFFFQKDELNIKFENNFQLNEDKSKISLLPIDEFELIISYSVDKQIDLSYLSYEKAVKWLKNEYKNQYEKRD